MAPYTTMRRDVLKRKVAAGKVVLVDSYHYDDMSGSSQYKGPPMPVELIDHYGAPRKEGFVCLHEHDFESCSGGAYVVSRDERGTVVRLRVHSNCSYTLLIKP